MSINVSTIKAMRRINAAAQRGKDLLDSLHDHKFKDKSKKKTINELGHYEKPYIKKNQGGHGGIVRVSTDVKPVL